MENIARNILIVDDNETIRHLLAEILQAEGYATSEASDGTAALELLEKTKVDAIISDIVMPNMDGYMFCYEVRRSSKHSTIPFIFLTATYTSSSDEQHALDIGADRILKKPISSIETLTVLHEMFSNPLYREPREIALIAEVEVVKQYTEGLAIKLEEKNIELQERTEELKKHSSALEQTADSIVITNKEGVIEYVNPSFEQTTGYKKEFAIGKTPAILKSGRHDAAFYERLWKTILSGKVFREEFVNRKSDGEFYYEQQTISPVLDGEGKVVHFVSTGRNVTENKRAEESLRESEERFRLLAKATSDTIWDWNLVTNTLWWNEGVDKLFGYNRKELDPTDKSWTDHIHPEDLMRVTESIHHAIERGDEHWEEEYRFQCQDGNYAWVQDRGHIIHDEAGKAIRMIGGMTDQTERKRSEEELRESEERFSGAFAHAPIGVALVSLDGHWIRVNLALCELVGYTETELLTRTFQEITHPADLEADLENVRRVIAGEIRSYEMEKRYVHKHGHFVSVLLSVSLVRDGRDRPRYFISQIQDITARKQVEARIVDALNYTRTLIDTSPIGIITFKITGEVVSANTAIADMTGGTVELIEKLNVFELESWKTSGLYSLANQALETGKLCEHEIYHHSTFNKSLWMNARFIPFAYKDERHLLGMFIDITAHKLAIEDLVQSEEKYRTLFEESKDGLFISTPDGKIIDVNPALVAMHGYDSKEEMLKLDITKDIYSNESERERLLKKLESEGFVENFETIEKRKDGQTIHVLLNVTAVRDNEGNISMIRGLTRDVTRQRQLEQQSLRSQRMESIGTLAGGIAHDLNNVLAPIVMGIEMLKSKITDDGSQKLLHTLEVSAQRGSNMVKQVLVFARGISGERIVLQAEYQIREIQKIVQQTFPKSIEFGTAVPQGLWCVSADATQLHQVLLNLCVNARDAMPEGGTLTISAENTEVNKNYAMMHAGAREGPYVVLTVADTGTGIPPDLLDKIFDPFFTTKEIGKGTGLGLSSVHSIVKSHGGFVTVYSEMGRGTKFRVYLPAELTAREKKSQPEHAELENGHGEFILVVDDEASIRDICQVALESHGYNVLTAADGMEAVVQYTQRMNDIRLVITDMMMPNMDGRATIRALRKINPEVKVIAISGLMVQEKSKDHRELPGCAFLAKPFTVAKLLATVSDVLAGEEGMAMMNDIQLKED